LACCCFLRVGGGGGPQTRERRRGAPGGGGSSLSPSPHLGQGRRWLGPVPRRRARERDAVRRQALHLWRGGACGEQKGGAPERGGDDGGRALTSSGDDRAPEKEPKDQEWKAARTRAVLQRRRRHERCGSPSLPSEGGWAPRVWEARGSGHQRGGRARRTRAKSAPPPLTRRPSAPNSPAIIPPCRPIQVRARVAHSVRRLQSPRLRPFSRSVGREAASCCAREQILRG